MEWQPIETAPKIGVEIILFWDSDHIGVGKHFPVDEFSEECWVAYGSGRCNPTHWMPLPPPPKDKA